MPFNGGGGGALPPHEHTNIANDGGPLDFNNTTIGSMNAGDITYSDGNALQTLAYPGVPAGETLTAAALSTAPSWSAGAGGGAAYELLGSTELGAPASDMTLAWASESFADVAAIDIFFSCLSPGNSNGMSFQFNGLTTGYDWDAFHVVGGTLTGLSVVNQARVYTTINSEYFTGHFRIIAQDPSTTAGSYNYFTYCGEIVCMGASGFYQVGGHIQAQDITASDSIRIFPPAGNIGTGGVISAYKINRT